MYTDYFGFREKPFHITADPRFFFETPAYKEAYANLLAGIHERKGFLLLTGEAGTGKTTLLHRLMADLKPPVWCVLFDNARVTFEELLNVICTDLGLPTEKTGRLQKIRALNAFLLARLEEGGTGVILIDEGQDLDDHVLENLRLLWNTQTTTETPLFQTVLAGQPRLLDKLAQHKLRQLKQRIAVQCNVTGLTAHEVGPFIHHRLRTAGSERHDLFPPAVIQRIAEYSQGIPRLINVICDNALLTTYRTDQKAISIEIVDQVAHELDLRAEPPQQAKAGVLSPGHTEEVKGSAPLPILPWRTLLSGAIGLLLVAAGVVVWQQPQSSVRVFFEHSPVAPARAPSPIRAEIQPPELSQDEQNERNTAELQVAKASPPLVPLPPLLITHAEPDSTGEPGLVIAEGQALEFAVEAHSAEGEPLDYVWLLDGQVQAQGSRWTYTPTFDEGGDQAKAIAAVITDSAQQRVEQYWQVQVTNVNRPPVITRVMPAAEEIDVEAGETQRFTVEATDPDTADTLAYRWSLDGQEISQAMSWEFESLPAEPQEATRQVSVAVFDQAGQATEHRWTVVVAAARPLPPQILRFKPTTPELHVAEGRALEFMVEAQGAQGQSLDYVWLLDGRPQAQGSRWTYTPTFDDGGDQAKAIAAVITDPTQQRVEQHWQVRVADVNRPPVITRVMPAAGEIALAAGQTQRFTVKAIDPDTADTLAYRWSLDGQEVGQGESWRFAPSAPAVQQQRWVRLEIADRGGLTARSAWQVTISPPVPPPPSIAARPRQQVSPPPVSVSISEQEVRTWLEAQRQAWQAKNVDQLVSMGVLDQSHADRARTILAAYQNFQVAFQEVQIRLKGSQAEVSFSRTDTIDGRVVAHPDRKVLLLEKAANDRLTARLP